MLWCCIFFYLWSSLQTLLINILYLTLYTTSISTLKNIFFSKYEVMFLYYRWEKLSFSFVMYCATASYCNIIVVKTNKNMKLRLSYITWQCIQLWTFLARGSVTFRFPLNTDSTFSRGCKRLSSSSLLNGPLYNYLPFFFVSHKHIPSAARSTIYSHVGDGHRHFCLHMHQVVKGWGGWVRVLLELFH